MPKRTGGYGASRKSKRFPALGNTNQPGLLPADSPPFAIAPARRGRVWLKLFLLQSVSLFAVFGLGTSEARAECVREGTVYRCAGTSTALTVPSTFGPLVTVDQQGQLNGLTINGVADSFVVNSGGINQTFTVSNGTNFTFENRAGSNNTPLNATVSNQISIINRQGAQINQVNLQAPNTTIDNSGRFNSPVAFGSGSLNVIQNRVGGVMNGVTATGNSTTRIQNQGVITGTISLGDGNNWYVNLGTTGQAGYANTITMGAGDDTFYIQDGEVTSRIDLGAGNDWAAILGGVLSSDLHAGAGNDRLHWAGGIVRAGIFMEDGDDTAVLYDLTPDNLPVGQPVDGGLGNDTMIWQNTVAGDVARFDNWELISLTRNSEMTFSNWSTLVLGDQGTGTGRLTVDSTSRILAGGGTHTVAPYGSGQLVRVENAGVIDLTNAGSSTTDRFVIMGEYLGQSGQLNLQTVLGGDNSPSDQLVLRGSGARAAGDTLINITNVGGLGAMTTGNGIRVVDADFASGARTDDGAFTLNGRVLAGIYEYQLYYGGVNGDAGDNDWYLRSHEPGPANPEPPATLPAPLPPPPDPGPEIVPPMLLPPEVISPQEPIPVDPEDPPTDPEPTPTVPGPPEPAPSPPPPVEALPPEPTPPDPGGPGPDESTPLIRPEIPGYVLAPAIAQRLGIAALDRFHAREGDQSLLTAPGTAPAGWVRFFGRAFNQHWSPQISGPTINPDFDLDPSFDGGVWGLQAGFDILATENEDGAQNRFGVFLTHAGAHGQVAGTTLAQLNRHSGTLNLNAESLGLYWTHVAPEGWYLDAVAMGSWLHGRAASDLGVGVDLSGSAWLASLEAGYPIALDEQWTIEPQAQLILQHVNLGDTRDPFSSIEYGTSTGVTGRIGVRLEGDLEIGDIPVQPFADINLWHDFGSGYDVTMNNDTIRTNGGGTSLELGAGLSAQISSDVSLYGAVNYTTGLDGNHHDGFGAHVGLRITW